MQVGIVSYGAYIPIYRLDREKICEMWSEKRGNGERSVANVDEDAITMGVAAALDCLKGFASDTIDGLYFASNTAPYREKQSASIIATALDLRTDIFTADFCNSMGAGAQALRSACDAVKAGTAKRVLVIASDCRIPPPNSVFELTVGDGAAALLVGEEEIIAEIEGNYAISSSFLDSWRRERGDRYFRSWEDRFVIEKGYWNYGVQVMRGFFERYNFKPKDFAKAAYYGPDIRSHKIMARKIGLSQDQIQDPLFEVMGNTGCAFFMMLLIAAFENLKVGERVLCMSYGDGADAWSFRLTEQIEKVRRDRRGIAKHLASKMMLPSYGKYVRFRDLMEWEAKPFPPVESSLNVFYRDEKALIRGYGQRCKVCKHVQFPPQRICMWCQTKDQFEDVKIVDKRGKLFTFSVDERAVFSLDLPNVLVIVDLEGGGRIYSQATDRDPRTLEIGMEMEFTFRKFHEGSGFHNYSWKLRPVRC